MSRFYVLRFAYFLWLWLVLSFGMCVGRAADLASARTETGRDRESRLVELQRGAGATGNGALKHTYDDRTRRIVRHESLAGGACTTLVFAGGTSAYEFTTSPAEPVPTSTFVPTVTYVRGSDGGGGIGGILYGLRSPPGGGTPVPTYLLVKTG